SFHRGGEHLAQISSPIRGTFGLVRLNREPARSHPEERGEDAFAPLGTTVDAGSSHGPEASASNVALVEKTRVADGHARVRRAFDGKLQDETRRQAIETPPRFAVRGHPRLDTRAGK